MEQSVAIVTGAGGGIGRAAAQELAKIGYRVALVGRTLQTLEETARGAAEPLVLPADLTDVAQVQALVQRVLDQWGRIDAVVHSAGYAPIRTVEQITDAEWRAVIDTNLSAAFYLSRAVWPAFRRQNGGVIVNLSSMSSRDPFAGFAAYGAAKAGVNLLGLALAREGAEIGVRIHTIAPGAVETAMFRSIRTVEQYPTEMTLSPEEVAKVICQCIAGELRYTSGEVIYLRKAL